MWVVGGLKLWNKINKKKAVEREREASVYLLLLVVDDHDKSQDLLGGDAKRIHRRQR
jgi:hypothetical protein